MREWDMTVIEAFLQGLIQGFTEFLPISSSGHLSLFQHFFKLSGEGALFFSVMLHLGTLIAVLIAFWDTIWKMVVEFFRLVKDLFTGKFRWNGMNESRSMLVMIVIATLPLAGFYFLKGFVERFSTDGDILVEGVGFLITGTLLFLASRKKNCTKTAVDMTAGDALLIGVVQGIATIPGISRSGSTVGTGILRGYSKEFMVAFSFILGIPAVLGSSASELSDAVKAGSVGNPIILIIGVVTSAVAGFFAIKLVRWLVKTDRFQIFAYYLWALGIVTVTIGVLEYLHIM